MQKTEYQAELFKNRLCKNYKHLSKWARRQGVFAYRLYDKDIPEIPVSVDIFLSENAASVEEQKTAFAVLALYKRPYEKSEVEEACWLSTVAKKITEVTKVPAECIAVKERKKQKGKTQYKKFNSAKNRIIVKEGACLFFLNLQDYIDTGLFLDHRPARLKVFKDAKGKTVLNLFAYTGAFSVHALAGGALSADSVDLSNTYLEWAQDNLVLNKLYERQKSRLIKSDVIAFLEEAAEKKTKWDLIICDPPTFSNSKSAAVFDVNRDWLRLCLLCVRVLQKNGILYFSSNSLKLKFDSALLKEECKKIGLKNVAVKDITKQSIPEDFRNKKIHRMWEIAEACPG